MVGLLIIALGTGGIKPCVSSFGGDQFQVGFFSKFSRFYFLKLFVFRHLAVPRKDDFSVFLRFSSFFHVFSLFF
jgi:dipeptide/tripeptide permease